MPNLLESPHILALYLKITMEEITPRYIYPVIQEGIKDGSIVCEHPMEVAESLAVLANVWMNPLIYPYEKKDVAARYKKMIHIGMISIIFMSIVCAVIFGIKVVPAMQRHTYLEIKGLKCLVLTLS